MMCNTNTLYTAKMATQCVCDKTDFSNKYIIINFYVICIICNLYVMYKFMYILTILRVTVTGVRPQCKSPRVCVVISMT